MRPGFHPYAFPNPNPKIKRTRASGEISNLCNLGVVISSFLVLVKFRFVFALEGLLIGLFFVLSFINVFRAVRLLRVSGLVLHTCPNIQALLSAASTSASIAPALQNAAVQYLDAPVVPYPIIRDLWVQLTPAYGVPFHQVLAGSSFVLEAPKLREKSKELKESLARLQELAEQKAYKELVKDITKHEGDGDREYFSSNKNSLGFGIHVVAIMFTGYMFGYAIFRSQFQNSPSMHAAGGVLGLIAGMFVETILFIVRASLEERNTKVKLQTKEKPKPFAQNSI